MNEREKLGLFHGVMLNLMLLLTITIGLGMWEPLWFALRKAVDPWH